MTHYIGLSQQKSSGFPFEGLIILVSRVACRKLKSENWHMMNNQHVGWHALNTEEVGHGSKGMLGRVVGSRSVVTNLRAVRISRNDKFALQKGRKSVNSAIYSISFLRLPLAHID